LLNQKAFVLKSKGFFDIVKEYLSVFFVFHPTNTIFGKNLPITKLTPQQ
jgi:hypothetical protein